MSRAPWFKFFAFDYLLDSGVDSLPREAEGLLVRMWCICHIEGSCPAEASELARKTRLSTQWVTQWLTHCLTLFESRDGRLYSRRMEEEKSRSDAGREYAARRWKQKGCEIASGSPTGSAIGEPNAQSQSQSQILKTRSPKKRLRHTSPPKTSLPENFGISEPMRAWAAKNGHTRLEEHLEHFVGYVKAHGRSYADWTQAFQNAVRDNWAKLPEEKPKPKQFDVVAHTRELLKG